MRPRVVFLDFGGTLVESVPDSFPEYAWVFRRFGVPVDQERWKEADQRVWQRLGPTMYECLGKTPSFWDRVHAGLLHELGVSDSDGRICAALHDRFTSPELHRPFPETEEVLGRLRSEGLALHIVSNNTDFLPETLSRLGWTERFDSVTFSQEIGAEKPDHRVFDLALRRAGCKPVEALHVGDSWDADYLGAKGAGVRGVWLNRRSAPNPGPCESIRDLRELQALL